MTTSSQDHITKLNALFQADALARRAEQELMETRDQEGLSAALCQAARENIGQGDESTERLILMTGLLAQVRTAEAAGALFELIDGEHAEDEGMAQAVAEALVELGESRFALLKRAALDALDQGASAVALEVLGFVVGELESAGKIDLLLAMLGHDDPQVVLAAIEVAGEQGWDDRVWAKLSSLTKDQREVTVDDEHEGRVILAISELASEVVETLRALGRGDDA